MKESRFRYHSRIPLYIQLETLLRNKIELGEISSAEKLPSGKELSQTYGVSQITVKKALATLSAEGLLRRQRGKGTFISGGLNGFRSIKLTGSMEDLIAHGLETEVRILEVKKTTASERVAKFLKVPIREEILLFRRLRQTGDEPFAYVVNYLPIKIGLRITPQDLKTKTMLQVLEKTLRLPLGPIRQSIEAIAADGEIASHLNIHIHDPVLHVETEVFLKSGEPLELVRTFYRADRYRYTIEVIRSPQSPMSNQGREAEAGKVKTV
ncbi:MAG: GntR family transcriptional regulator [Deltaproteobacteria bacterium]|nr:GntR family transcriptional regulator [Deltaproteobacteria bacterium]